MKTMHLFLIFVLVVIVQLFVPAKMIFEREAILETGTVYKFKTQPIDPSDPFRGKYVTLNYEIDAAETKDSTWQRGEDIKVYIENDSLGYAKVYAVSRKKLEVSKDYINAKVGWNYRNVNSVNFILPFNRYYMEESKAQPAEAIYRKYNRRRDTINQTYATVAVKNGEAVLKDVYINDKPILYYINMQDKN